MELDEAFQKAVRKFYAGEGFEKFNELKDKKVKYTKEALDEVEKFVRKKIDKSKLEEEVSEGDVSNAV